MEKPHVSIAGCKPHGRRERATKQGFVSDLHRNLCLVGERLRAVPSPLPSSAGGHSPGPQCHLSPFDNRAAYLWSPRAACHPCGYVQHAPPPKQHSFLLQRKQL